MVDPISGAHAAGKRTRETKQRVRKARPIPKRGDPVVDADYHKFTEAVVRVLMADQRETA
jgi:hypothetical protein